MMEVPPKGTLQPGHVLQNRYQINGIIGLGNTGAVYQARDLNYANVTKLCAVKELVNLAQDPKLREQTIGNFVREAEILAVLSHPAIPKIYDFFFGDRAYLVMEYIPGRDLETILNDTDGFLPVEQVHQWGVEICNVLGYLHTHEPPVVFRNMQPSNVMIDIHRRVWLIGFSLATVFRIGQPRTMAGTEGYAAPEQLQRGESSPAGDVYALGATLHHLLTRRDPRLEPPFSFDLRPIREFNPDVPEGFVAIVERALAIDPQKRFVTAEEMGQALEALRSG
jgi:serine/threonine protein kinase